MQSTVGSCRDPATPLDDGQIAEIAEAIDFQQARTARLATSSASDPEVRAFAGGLLLDHEEEQQSEGVLVKGRRRIDVQPSALTERFESAARETRRWPSNESGSTFDRDFLASEVKEQTRQLDWLDHILVPVVHDPGFGAELLHRRSIAAPLLDEASRVPPRLPAP
ncbi:MAG: DUF4142 domain-containing protein [Polyangiaceae bacterium]